MTVKDLSTPTSLQCFAYRDKARLHFGNAGCSRVVISAV